jgi:hypothetical protein
MSLVGAHIDPSFNGVARPGQSIVFPPLSDRLAPGVFFLFVSGIAIGVEVDVWVDPVCIGTHPYSNCSTPLS